MQINSVKTHKVVPGKQTLFDILDTHITVFKERSILAITSKIVAICDGRVISKKGINKLDLIKNESQLYLSPDRNQYNLTITIKDGFLIPSAGIDESNSADFFVLWPQDSQKTANDVRAYLKKRFKVRYAGVLITDSKSSPLRLGTTGIAIAHSGFKSLNNYIGTPDIFGRTLKVTKANVMDALAVAAVSVMGEGKEQTPLAVIEDVPFVNFVNKNPSIKELDDLKVPLNDDLYSVLLQSVVWEKGGS